MVIKDKVPCKRVRSFLVESRLGYAPRDPWSLQ